jgi:hypothetical protein
MTDHARNQLDLGKISFPSDALTIGMIRKALPDLFLQDDPDFFKDEFGSVEVSGILRSERILAQRAFASALGRPDPYLEEPSRQEMIESLAESYKLFGLASGQQHTNQLVRAFENEAVDLAKKNTGPTPL